MSISVGSVSVDVVPDARGFAEDLKAKLKSIRVSVPVEADTAKMRADIDEAARTRTATINVDVDATRARLELDALQRPRTANIGVNASGLTSAFSSMSGLATAIVALGPALIPITAAVAGLVAVLAAPLAAAGGGLTIGAFIAGFAIKDTEKQKKQIDELAKKVQASKNALAAATTPAGRKSAAAKLAEDTAAYQAALGALTPAQRKFLAAQEKLKGSFHDLMASAGGAVFGPLIKGMNLLSRLMPALRPLIRGVSGAIGTLLGDLGKMVSGPQFKAFMRSFGHEAGSAIVTFGRAFGLFAKGLFFLFRAFKPLSKDFTSGISGAFGAFAGWAKALPHSKSFQAFLSYLRDVGPKVADAIGHIFGAFAKIAEILAPLGGVVLGLVDGLALMIDKAKPGQIAAIAGALGGAALALAAFGGPAIAIPAAIVAVAGSLGYAYKHFEPFRRVVQNLTGWFRDQLMPALDDAAKKVWPALLSAVDSVKQSISDNQGLFIALRDVFRQLGRALTNVVIPAMADIYRVELPALGKALGAGITLIRLQADAWTLLAIVGLQSLKALFLASIATFDGILTAADKALGWMPKFGPKIHDARKAFDGFKDGTVAAIDAAIGEAQKLHAELNFKPKTIRIHFAIDKPPRKSIQGVPIFQSFGAEGAGATGAIVNRPTVALIGENGPEALTPLSQTPGNQPLPNGMGGPQFNVEKVVAQDVNDFLRQMQVRARQSSLDGVRR